MTSLGVATLRLPRHARAAAIWLLAAAVYFASIRLSLQWGTIDAELPLLWIPAGVGFALVLSGGGWIAVPIGVAAAGSSALHGLDAVAALLFTASASLGALAALAVVRALRVPRHGERVADTLAWTLAGVAAAAVGAGFSTLAVSHMGALDKYGNDFVLHAFLANVAGFLVGAPVVGSWLRRRCTGVAGVTEQVALVLVAGALAEAVSVGALGHADPSSYLVFPVVLWSALRAGRRGVATAILVIALVAASNAAHGTGPFAAGNGDQTSISLAGFLIVMSLTGLLLAGLQRERGLSDADLRRSEERFRAMIETATDVITVLAPDGTILYASPSVVRIIGWEPEELVGGSAFGLVHPDDRSRVEALFARVAAGEQVSASFRFRHRDGRWLDLESVVRDLSSLSAIGGILVNSRDVSDGRKTERELQEAEHRYRTLVERLPLVTYINDVKANVPPLYVSPQIEDLLGYPASDWLEDAQFADRVIHPDDAKRLDQLLVEDGHGNAVSGEYRMVAADGRVVWVLDHMVTLRDEEGRPAAVQGFLVDITERKLLEEQLRHAQRMEALGLLAGGVAHDFNNLLTAISGYTELALTHAHDPTLFRRDIEEVRAAGDRAASLTRQLLAFGRRQVLENAVVDLNDVVAEMQQLLARLIGENIEIATELEAGLGSVRCDPGQLEQVIVNLAVNARDAMPDGGTLSIATSAAAPAEVAAAGLAAGDYAVLSVSDTGHGMDTATAERVFEPFFTTKEVGKGTGLGLAMVYGIVEQSQGHVAVRSAPGRGAEFRLLLPATDENGASGAGVGREARQARGPEGAETVLLVEDEEVVRRLTAEMLERQGYRVIAVDDPRAALEISEPWDLLLTDVVMPGMSGPDLASRLVTRRPGRGVLFTSGYSGDTLPEHGVLGADLLEKPFTMDELARKVREALDARLVS